MTISHPPLTPINFIKRSGVVFAERTAIVDGDLTFTYREFLDRCLRGTSVLARLGVDPGDRVAVLSSNCHLLLELHHSVPLRGAVLVAMNTRLTAEELTYIARHSGAKALIASYEFAEIARQVASATGVPLLVGARPDDEYEDALSDVLPDEVPVTDERGLLAINYTSGTTGRPKGVVYHHRGACLQALSRVAHAKMDSSSAYLWTLPMFHCNGWCNTWGVTAAGATHICLRTMDVVQVWHSLEQLGVTHFSAAPTVLTMIADSAVATRLPHPVSVDTGGAPPSPSLLSRLAALNMSVTHLYGLTETFGPIGINEWQPAWDKLGEAEQSRLRARQGVSNIIADPLRVVDATGRDVPADGDTLGEIAACGNTIMLGYYQDPEATKAACLDGWFMTGDLAVMHPDGYIEIKDRRKDIIISGGENISSVEVERTLDSHPAVLESAVVATPDVRWGEVPVAFITLRPGLSATPAEIQDYARSRLAGFKAPKHYRFGPLPKTSTGKIQKAKLREMLQEEVSPNTGPLPDCLLRSIDAASGVGPA